MRNGDFSEVLAINPDFQIYDPATGNADGTGTDRVPRCGSFRPIASAASRKQIQALYPAPNNPGTNNGLQNNSISPANPKADRDNYDFKVDWNRSNNAPGVCEVLDHAGQRVRHLQARL